jgi:hypothetical protein
MKTLSFDELEYVSGGITKWEALKALAYQIGIGAAVEGVIEGVRYIMDGEGALRPSGSTTGYVCAADGSCMSYNSNGYSCTP